VVVVVDLGVLGVLGVRWCLGGVDLVSVDAIR